MNRETDKALETLRGMADPGVAARVREEVDAMGVGQLRLLVEAHLLRDLSADDDGWASFLMRDVGDDQEELDRRLRAEGYVPDWESGLAFDRSDESIVSIKLVMKKIEREAR